MDQVNYFFFNHYLGTISGPTDKEFGSCIELSQNGKQAFKVGDEERTFLNDGDAVIFRGIAQKDGIRIGFGECRSAILPALN